MHAQTKPLGERRFAENASVDDTNNGSTAVRRSKRAEEVTHLSLIDGDPVGWAEPPVVFDVRNAVLQVAVPLRQVHLEQVLQQILQLVGEVRRVLRLSRRIRNSRERNNTYFPGDDLLVDLNGSVREERRIAGCHFVDQHAERPPVDRTVVALAEDDLWR